MLRRASYFEIYGDYATCVRRLSFSPLDLAGNYAIGIDFLIYSDVVHQVVHAATATRTRSGVYGYSVRAAGADSFCCTGVAVFFFFYLLPSSPLTSFPPTNVIEGFELDRGRRRQESSKGLGSRAEGPAPSSARRPVIEIEIE